ncbi:hypothetical protein [Dysgonomonas sp. 520]|uniref:hypothetical protein n=1 Tax=Dysgonomonas sp. 520 TaxID=2302931 RepID=UPI0013D7C2E3|nr:hypothetical protein [Dysgonomonas sp. 520]NDW09018.1 hypothetical protein [Dysgonomonas sp. 520]
MKKFFYLLTICILTSVAFSSCGDDDDDYLSGDAAKGAIKGKWVLKTMTMSSNSSEMDRLMNMAFAYSLKTTEMSMIFNETTVESTMKYKDGSSPQIVTEDYYIEDNVLYVNDEALNDIVASNFRISKNNLEITQKNIDRNMLIEMLTSDDIDGIEQIINMIPNGFSGQITMKLKR